MENNIEKNNLTERKNSIKNNVEKRNTTEKCKENINKKGGLIMKVYKKQITVYDIGNGFSIETETTDGVTLFYLCHKDCDEKSFMFPVEDFGFMSEKQFVEAMLFFAE